MTVRELIEKLQLYNPDLTVCLADWSERHRLPNAAAVSVCQRNDHYRLPLPDAEGYHRPMLGDFVQIGV